MRTVPFSDDDDDGGGGGEDYGCEIVGSVNHRSRQSVFYALCLAMLDIEK